MATKRQPLSLSEQLGRCKMRSLSEGTRIWQLEAGPTPRYASPSSTNVGVAYEIVIHNADTGDISCNCKAAENGRFYKHLGAVLLHLDVSAEMELASEAAAEDQAKAEASSAIAEKPKASLADLFPVGT